MKDWFLLIPSMAWRLKKLCKALGFNPQELDDITAKELIGRTCTIKIVEDERARRNIVAFSPASEDAYKATKEPDSSLPF